MKNWSPVTKGLVVVIVLLFTVAFVKGTYDAVNEPSESANEAIDDIQKSLDKISD